MSGSQGFDVAPPEEGISAEPPRQAIFSQGNRIGLTIFAGAFLLFQVQLLMGKYILPWFGGTPAVWTACLLFFQVLLLAGDAYAHFVATRLTASPITLNGVVYISASSWEETRSTEPQTG